MKKLMIYRGITTVIDTSGRLIFISMFDTLPRT